ncbi:hypothetical protein [Priestia megaterium]|uniref:hypothetical protein n=1 Tax=Priestia megaterium TaxID=1404 RepID=UPI003CC5B6EB
MYLVEWTEKDGTVKSDTADCGTVLMIWMQEKTEQGLNPSYKTFEEVLAERV